MKKLFYVGLGVFLSVSSAFAQSTLREGRVFDIKDQPLQKEIKNHINANVNTEIKTIPIEDTILCTQTKKQYGWFAPLDTISRETAMKVGNYFRFSDKNASGHWGKLECLDSYGNYVKGSFAPYILKLGSAGDSDEEANKDWIEKLQTACIYEFISDYSGEMIIQERAYDEKMNIIYTFSRVPIGNNQYICSYKDVFGLPAEMRKSNDDEYTYGTLVKLTEDQWGNDSTIVFIDAKGKPKKNSDGADMEVYIHDKNGRLLKQESCNSDGSLTIDNWGNCGIEYQWNEKNQIICVTYMDDKWQPMRMPSLRAGGREDVITTNFKYDEFGRIIEEFYTDTSGKPDVNARGTHRITLEYNSFGSTIKKCGHDINNNLSPVSNSQSAIEIYEYDSKGNTLSALFYDKDKKPISTEGYLCKAVFAYDDTGKMILDERYSYKDGEIILSSKTEINPDYEYNLWYDGSSRLDSLDNKKRTTSIRFYDSGGIPEMVNGRASEIHTYIDLPEEHIELDTETNFDANGHKVEIDGIYKTVSKKDSTNHTITKWRYDCNDNLVEIYIHQYDDSFNRILAQYDANTWGVKSRSGGSASVRYYTGDVVYSQKGEYASLVGRDEFGEPDYITSSNITYYYSKIYSKSRTVYYDEDNNEIEDRKAIRDNLPKVMTIEVIDSTAYQLGLRDNDIILVYGDYHANLESVESYYDFRAEWSVRSILNAKKNNRMIVFRIEDAANNRFGLIEINNLTGTPSEQGYLPHIKYLTKRQHERIKKAIDDNLNSYSPVITEDDLLQTERAKDKFVVVAYTEMFRSMRNKPYARQVTDPSILLGSCIKDRNMYWDFSEGDNTEVFEEMLETRTREEFIHPKMHFFVTKNMSNVTHMEVDEQYVNTNWFDTRISDEDYNALLSLANSVKQELHDIQKSPSTINKKGLIANWQVEDKAADPYYPSGSLSFDNKGNCSGSLKHFGYITFAEGTAIFEIITDYSGSWYNNGIFLSINPLIDNYVTIRCIDLQGADEDLKKRALEFVNNECEKNPDRYLESIEFFGHPILGKELFILNLGNDKLTISDGTENGISFIKGKSVNKKAKKDNSTKKTKTKTSIISGILPFAGEWHCRLADFKDGECNLAIAKDGKTSIILMATSEEEIDDTSTIVIKLKVGVKAEGNVSGDSLLLSNISISSFDYDCDVIAPDEIKDELKEITIKALNEERDSIVMGILKELNFDNEVSITKFDENRLCINDFIFQRVETK